MWKCYKECNKKLPQITICGIPNAQWLGDRGCQSVWTTWSVMSCMEFMSQLLQYFIRLNQCRLLLAYLPIFSKTFEMKWSFIEFECCDLEPFSKNLCTIVGCWVYPTHSAHIFTLCIIESCFFYLPLWLSRDYHCPSTCVLVLDDMPFHKGIYAFLGTIICPSVNLSLYMC